MGVVIELVFMLAMLVVVQCGVIPTELDHQKEPGEFAIYNETDSSTTSKSEPEPTPMEQWCLIWYLGAFGCLIFFFLMITCTELFLGNPLYRRHNLNNYVQNVLLNDNKSLMPESPPPPYHLFAPPDYETIQKVVIEKRVSASQVFAVPVHKSSVIANGLQPTIHI